MSSTTKTIELIGEILNIALTDIPLLIQIVEKLIPIFKEDRVPTADEWTAINALLEKSHQELSDSIAKALAKSE